jgi:hypothetical protein
MHRCAHAAALIRDREYSALEFDGEARRRLEVAFKPILLRLAPRIVGEAGKYAKTVGKRREKRVSCFQIFPRERGPFVRPPAWRIGPHILDRGSQRIDICFRDAERNELAVAVFETGGGAEVIGVAHDLPQGRYSALGTAGLIRPHAAAAEYGSNGWQKPPHRAVRFSRAPKLSWRDRAERDYGMTADYCHHNTVRRPTGITQNVDFVGRTKRFVSLFYIGREHIFDPFHECADSARQIAPMCDYEGHRERPATKIGYDLHKRSTL